MSVIAAGASGQPSEVETNHRALRAVIRPSDVGALGAYSLAAPSGVMAAGLAGASPVWSFRYTGANICKVNRVLIGAGNAGTGFAAGVGIFNLFVARSFSASDTGGTAITPTLNKMRTSHATTGVGDARISSTATLTAGTRTLDGQAIGSIVCPVSTTVGIVLVNPQTPLFEHRVGEWPLVLANNEGLVIQATVPATGTWSFSVQVDWEEVSTYGTGLAA